MLTNKGKKRHSPQIGYLGLALVLWAAHSALPQAEAPIPFAEIPTVNVAGAEGNPAVTSPHSSQEIAVSVAGDSTPFFGRMQPKRIEFSSRWNGFALGYNADLAKDTRQEMRLGQAVNLGVLGSSAGILLRYGGNDDRRHFGLDFGAQASPLPQLRLGYYTRHALETRDGSPLEQRYAVGIRPWGHRQTASGFIEFGAGATILSTHSQPYSYARLPLGSMTNLWGYWAPEGNQVSIGFTANLSPDWRMGSGMNNGRGSGLGPSFRLAYAQPSTPHHLLSRHCVVDLDLNHSIESSGMPPSWFGQTGLDLRRLLRRFDYLEQDGDVRVVALYLGRMRADFATAEEIHDRVLRLRALGIQVVAFLDPDVSPMNYFVASAANRIAVQPQGHFGVQGFATEVTFYTGLLEKLGVEAQFLRHGKAKSFVEPFTRKSLSPDTRENLNALVSAWWDHYVHRVAEARGIPEASLRTFFQLGEIDLDSAHAAGLIDTLLQADQISAYAGGRERACAEPANRVAEDARWGDGEAIALVSLNGEITSGASRRHGLFGGETMGSETVVAELRSLRSKSRIRAVVLRLDSPGGMVQASDQIAREVDLLRQAGKKVVVSVGGEAASGAYYVACRADAIVAEPGSLVGSIGVLWGKVVTRGLYEKLGLTREGLRTEPHADAISASRPFSDEEITVVQRHLDHFYASFLDKIREGRHGKVVHLDSAGEGRVFTGTQALALGLVDTLGGLDLALREAGRLAGFPEWMPQLVLPVLPETGIAGRVDLESRAMSISPLAWDEIAAIMAEWEKPQAWAFDPAWMELTAPTR